MPTPRTTAVVQFLLPSSATRETLPLTREREFRVILTLDGQDIPAQSFYSPLNDAMWRDFLVNLSTCNTARSLDNYDQARNISNVGRSLYLALCALSPELTAFLNQADTPRRLVIQTRRPELHLLPWGALVDSRGNLLAAGDLSIVQTWSAFTLDPFRFSESINLIPDFGSDTLKKTLPALDKLPPEITRDPLPHGALDILHLEEHGDRALNQIGGAVATHLLALYKDARMALLWSCYSGSGGNSWGDSPALILHRGGDPEANGTGAAMVLSFQAELHYQDAKSIAETFYADVFGPAATRDPEGALVRIRASKFEDEFEFANWASMTVYLRQPLDLSALPLNGPRVPAAMWSATPDPANPGLNSAWDTLADAVAHLQPGSISSNESLIEQPANPLLPLPNSVFAPWRGNVIRLDGAPDALSDQTLRELNLRPADAPTTGDADRLTWFFEQVKHFGAPLVVWTNSRPHHLDFLKTVVPDSSLTFLLLFGPEPQKNVPELVDHNRLDEARALYIPSSSSDEEHAAAYFAFARGNNQLGAERCLSRISSGFERLLLSGNFVSRFKIIPRQPADVLANAVTPDPGTLTPGAPGSLVSGLKSRQCEEDFYRKAIDLASGDTLLRDRGRARHELAYCLASQGRNGAAKLLYRMALQDLERSPIHDLTWNSAFGNTLRDWADLQSTCAEELEQARALLSRALAIHSLHGRRQQIAYSLLTRSQIALTACHTRQAIDDAVDAANRFEDIGNWGGWFDSLSPLLDALADARETFRMLHVIRMAGQKIRHAGLAPAKVAAFSRTLLLRKAQTHWIAGNFDDARHELEALERRARAADPAYPTSDLAQQVGRLQKFLGPGPTSTRPRKPRRSKA